MSSSNPNPSLALSPTLAPTLTQPPCPYPSPNPNPSPVPAGTHTRTQGCTWWLFFPRRCSCGSSAATGCSSCSCCLSSSRCQSGRRRCCCGRRSTTAARRGCAGRPTRAAARLGSSSPGSGSCFQVNLYLNLPSHLPTQPSPSFPCSAQRQWVAGLVVVVLRPPQKLHGTPRGQATRARCCSASATGCMRRATPTSAHFAVAIRRWPLRPRRPRRSDATSPRCSRQSALVG